MEDLITLPNIGKKLAKQLQSIGINSYQDLIDMGSIEAIIKIKGTSGKGCYNMLYALEGAIRGIRWHHLSKNDKDRLKAELEQAIVG
ncbi:MAG: TfoX/Sxy family protein [Spirochaetales bacterium]|nr:TfoX/Sxy family protein [Spirochaetales bacterium]